MRYLLALIIIVSLAACSGRTIPIVDDTGAGPDDDGFVIVPDSGVDPDTSTTLPDLALPGKVTVYTDKTSYGMSEVVTGTVHNGTSHSIFLPGCGIFDREHMEQGSWANKGPSLICAWEGEAVEVKPGAIESQEAGFHLPGTWRLSLRYGVGCTPGPGIPLGGAGCTSFETAVSPQVQVKVDQATCDKLNQSYINKLEKARQCDESINTPQCLTMVQPDLICGCPIYVNDASVLKPYEEKWQDWGCAAIYPPCGIKCVPPAPMACVNDTCVPAV